MQQLIGLSREVGALLAEKELMLVTAESCTGGGIAAAITDVGGSSGWFERAFITYSNEAKMDMLGVNAKTLMIHGAVSQEVVLEMAAGALRHSQGSVAISVSGIAGPGGGSDEKPVGTVWFGWKIAQQIEQQQVMHFKGDRSAVRYQACCYALEQLHMLLSRC